LLGIVVLGGACVSDSAVIVDEAGTVVLESSLADLAPAGKSIGTAVTVQGLFNEDYPNLAARYREVAASQFSLVVPESEMKMASLWKGPEDIDFTTLDRIADWAFEEGLSMRGHVLLWHRSVPGWLSSGFADGTYNGDAVASMVEWYIGQVMGHFADEYPGLVVAWDVVNEAIGPNDATLEGPFELRPAGYDYAGKGEDFWHLSLGDDYEAQAFRWARAADPDAKLFYNDYHNEYVNPKADAIFALVEDLQAEAVPIDGVGLQCHFHLDWLEMEIDGLEFSLDAIGRTVDRWLETGLDVQITEVDVGMNAGDEEAQAAFYAGLLENTLLKDGVSAFVSWGFTDLASWREDTTPLYFDRLINPKPAWFAMVDILEAVRQ
jgi:endo-1,4-beta-xylanase